MNKLEIHNTPDNGFKKGDMIRLNEVSTVVFMITDVHPNGKLDVVDLTCGHPYVHQVVSNPKRVSSITITTG